MNITQIDPSTDYFTTQVPPDWEKAEIQVHREREDAEMAAYFQKCRKSGQPYIQFFPASGSILYVYFDRSQPPPKELIDQLGDLAWSFDLCHYHVLKGDLFQDCLDSSDAIPYQGRFSGSSRDWSREQTQTFVGRLSQLLPRFDRQAEIKSLVELAISAGYFAYWGNYPFGDQVLERDAEAAHEGWCKAHNHPHITLQVDDAYFTYEIFDKILNEQAVSAIDSLTRSVGLEGQYAQDRSTSLEVIGEDVPPVFANTEQVQSFVTRLTEILSDPRSHDSRRD